MQQHTRRPGVVAARLRSRQFNARPVAYVAMTRTERLFMTYHRESGFAKRLLAASARPAGA